MRPIKSMFIIQSVYMCIVLDIQIYNILNIFFSGVKIFNVENKKTGLIKSNKMFFGIYCVY